MHAEIGASIPILEVRGKDYSVIKDRAGFRFIDERGNLIVAFTKANPLIYGESYTIDTAKGQAGNLDKEGSIWALYEGPIRTRHEITFGEDNAVIRAAWIIITKLMADSVAVPAVAIEADGTAKRTTMKMSAGLHQALSDAIDKANKEST